MRGRWSSMRILVRVGRRPTARRRAPATPVTVVPSSVQTSVPLRTSVASSGKRRWRHAFPSLRLFVSFLPSPILFATPQPLFLLLVRLPFLLLCLEPRAILLPLTVSLLPLRLPTQPYLLLFLPIESIALCVITSGTQCVCHFGQFFLLGRCHSMPVRRLEASNIRTTSHGGKQFCAQCADLSLNLGLVNPAEGLESSLMGA